MDVYRGADKVAELGSYDELRVGANKPAFVYEGAELVYPSPVKDGLILWYDFSGRTNGDAERGVAEDLSGNGNHGTLQNFNYTAESGYDKTGLLFDGVDDGFGDIEIIGTPDITFEVSFIHSDNDDIQGLVSTHRHTGDVSGFTFSTNSSHNLYSNAGYKDGDRLTGVRSSRILNDGEKIHAILTYRSEKKRFDLYINGVPDSFALVEDKEVNIEETTRLTIGKWAISTSIYRQAGAIHSVKVYNRPLTPEEIAHNYAIEKERFGIE